MNIFIKFLENIRRYGLEAETGRYYATYKGIVADNQDPECLGRLQLKCPAVWGDDIFDDWVFPKGMPAGKNWGFFWIPSKGDSVWISFENGDPSYPIWEYGWYGTGETPENAKRKDVSNYMFQTPKGQRMEFDDQEEKIIITSKKQVIEMSKDGFKITNGSESLAGLIGELFDAFSKTTTSTLGGPQPFINIAEYNALKVKFKKLLY